MVERLDVSAEIISFDNETEMVENLTALVVNGSECFAPGAGNYVSM